MSDRPVPPEPDRPERRATRHRRRSIGRMAAAALAALIAVGATPSHAAQPRTVDPALRAALVRAIQASDSFHDRFDAEVWLTDMAERLGPIVPDPKERMRLLRTVHREARRAHLPPELVLAVIDAESHFDRFAISRTGAEGLMQVMPFWLKEIGHPEDNLFRIGTNLRLGCTILRYYLDKAKGNLTRALMLYNGSPGNFHYTNRVFRLLSQRWYRR